MHSFRVWAPAASRLSLQLGDVRHQMEGPDPRGVWQIAVEDALPGMDYTFLIDDDPRPYPDPRSCHQPQGVHGPSRLYDHRQFKWSDLRWQAPPFSSAVLYELHVGTFTPEGTLDAAMEKIPYLCELGITHVEIMPVAESAGEYGWGYDGVDLFAVRQAYGGPDALKRFVDACHEAGLAVLLDVVYNHFGPEGNYTGKFGPYVTERHLTPWGAAINFEDSGSDEVRSFFLDNASMWLRDFHIDGLRLDAVHEIIDRSAVHFLEELATHVSTLAATLGRSLVLIAESDLNNPRLVAPIEANGFGLDAQWSDDFHHALFTVLHEEHGGYYDDFGSLGALAKAIKSAFVYDGQYSVSRKRHHGRPVDGLSSHHFVVCIQNHDQVGNRASGERLGHLVGPARAKVGIGLLLVSPFIPLLFQGEEFAASSPFQYFVNTTDAELGAAISEGRKREFAGFGWDVAQIADPVDPQTFACSKLRWSEVGEPEHAEMLDWTRQLIRLRRMTPALHDGDRSHLEVSFHEKEKWLRMDRSSISVFINLGPQDAKFDVSTDYRLELASNTDTSFTTGHLTLPPDTIAMLMNKSA